MSSLLRQVLSLCVCATLAGAAPSVCAELTFEWVDEFTADEQAKLTAWVREVHGAVERIVGPLPVDVRTYMHRRDGAREPVPWARTQRYRGQGVHFHVDPAYSLDAFRHDWTAPHELSHLILPYVGARHAWFAEGFASHMQYRVMQAMGVLSGTEAERRYRRKLESAERNYDYPAVSGDVLGRCRVVPAGGGRPADCGLEPR